MRKPLAILTCILLLAACSKDQPDYESRISFYANPRSGEVADSVLTCVTYNIQLGFRAEDDPWTKEVTGGTQAQVEALRDILVQLNPDIVCLQEVPLNRYNTEVKDFIRALASAMNMNYAFGAHGYNDPYGIEPVEGQWGNAILTRFEITEIENRENEYNSVWERRSILVAGLRLGPGRMLRTYSLHHIPSDKSVPQSMNLFGERNTEPQLIMGDFNMTMVPEMNLAGYSDVLETDSLLRYSIDRIYTGGFACGILETGMIAGSDTVSDHPAVYCRLKLEQR
jgi:endonuclease/exonuclease/phosphatase family metal-dependent hydrolase